MYTFFIFFAIGSLFFADVLAPIYIVKFKNINFSRQSLQNEERILSISKTHWLVLFKIIVIQFLILTIFLPILVNLIKVKRGNSIGNINQVPYGFIFFILLGIWLLFTLRKQVLFWCREFVITDKRVLDKCGALREFRYDKVESCDVVQNIWGRFFGYGSIIVRGVGGSSIIERYVKEPFEFKQYLINVISNKNESHKSDLAQSTTNQNDLIMKLQSYKKLFDEGVITQEDFDKKKQQIISEI